MKKKLISASAALFLSVLAVSAQTKDFEIANPKVDQGGVLIIKIDSRWMPPATFNPAIAVFGKRYLPNKYGEVFVGVPVDVKPDKYIVALVEYGRGVRLSWDYGEMEVVQKNYPTRVRAPFIPTPKWKREQRAVALAFSSGDYLERYFDSEFIKPLDEVIIDKNRAIGGESSPFGRGHNGIDLITLDSKTGQHKRPVKAVNSGRVALIARDFSTEGNMIILDHGSGIFSVYMHLSKFLVKRVGDKVERDDVIAVSGDTGSAKRGGPHLHFSVKIRSKDGKSNVYVDPLGFMETVNKFL